jgi:ATP-dependent DNA ligase
MAEAAAACGRQCRSRRRRRAAAVSARRSSSVAYTGFGAKLVAEVKYLAWTGDNLLRQVVYEGLREDKPAAEVRRELPHPKPGGAKRVSDQ